MPGGSARSKGSAWCGVGSIFSQRGHLLSATATRMPRECGDLGQGGEEGGGQAGVLTQV